MPEDKDVPMVVRLGGAALIAYNGWFLSYELYCHDQYPGCSYRYEAVTLSPTTAGDTGVIDKPTAVISSTY